MQRGMEFRILAPSCCQFWHPCTRPVHLGCAISSTVICLCMISCSVKSGVPKPETKSLRDLLPISLRDGLV
jgi:hypothetical protein